MKTITGYLYIDEKAEELLNQLPKEQQESLFNVYKKIHSAGIDEGYNVGYYRNKKGLTTGEK